ncbi:hypothetical protein Tco_0441189 [Tanacetum coccineum]
MGIRHAKAYTLRGKSSTKLGQSKRPPVITTVFSATTLENTPFAYRVSTSTNPNPMISPAFVEANYEVLESLLRERRRQIRNEDLRTKLEYFSEDYDEDGEMEPRPEPNREATPTLWPRSPVVRMQRERVVGFEEAPNREGSRGGRNAKGIRLSEIEAREDENRGVNLPPLLAAHLGRNESGQPLRSSLTSVHGGHQPSTNTRRNLLSNGTLLSHHAQPFIPSSLHTPTGLVPIHVNPYSQPSASLVNGQTSNFPFQTQISNPPAGGISTYHPQGGYIPQTFTNNGVPSYNGFMYPAVTPSSNYPFYTQPIYAPPNMPMYPNPAGSFVDSTSSVTPFVRWIEDYPLPDELKMPSHIGSYDGKGRPDNFLHLFEEAIRMQKWLMPVTCHMFTYTLKDSDRVWWNSQKTRSIINYEDLKDKFR